MAEFEEFEPFVRSRWPELLAIATAVSRTGQDGEDLVQAALLAAYQRWDRIRLDEAMAYLRRSIVNGTISRWRRSRSPQRPLTEQFRDDARRCEQRIDLVSALRLLPARQRSVLILRYLCDLSDPDIAATLGIAPSAVRSASLRGLATLRLSYLNEPVAESHR
jgi:RNA polymerase sigma-70 factor (sigma-E family)